MTVFGILIIYGLVAIFAAVFEHGYAYGSEKPITIMKAIGYGLIWPYRLKTADSFNNGIKL